MMCNVFLKLILIASLSSIALAAPNRERIGVSWVPYVNNDEHLDYLRETGHGRFFNQLEIENQNQLHLPFNTENGQLSEAFTQGLSKIKDAKNPELFFMLSSHGDPGFVSSQSCGTIPHRDLLSSIYKAIEKAGVKNPVGIHIVYMACMAGSMVETLEKTPPPKGAKVYLYASSRAHEKTYGESFHKDLEKTFSHAEGKSGAEMFNAYRSLQEGKLGSQNLHQYVGWTNDPQVLHWGQKDLRLVMKDTFQTLKSKDLAYALESFLRNRPLALQIIEEYKDQNQDLYHTIKLLIHERPTPDMLISLAKELSHPRWSHLIFLELSRNPALRSAINQAMAVNPEVNKAWTAALSQIDSMNIYDPFKWSLLESPSHSLEIMKALKKVPPLEDISKTLYRTPQSQWNEALFDMLDLRQPNSEIHMPIMMTLKNNGGDDWIKRNILNSENHGVRGKGVFILSQENIRFHLSDIMRWLDSPESRNAPAWLRDQVFTSLKESDLKSKETYEFLFRAGVLTPEEAMKRNLADPNPTRRAMNAQSIKAATECDDMFRNLYQLTFP